ncbi:hypothetical protein C0Z19_05920 [Trinickia soli]|uniref:Uncharacterized protein n=1 Tax=Trinickia soli TaxID=380675 RepID=A0A2N7WAS1_9BURK|nr:hypothetical protein C0Z19_05920 [Trinickia soli]
MCVNAAARKANARCLAQYASTRGVAGKDANVRRPHVGLAASCWTTRKPHSGGMGGERESEANSANAARAIGPDYATR